MMEPTFYGSTSVSDKGQVVVPAEAREALGLKRGDKLLVLSGPKKHALIFVKADRIQKIVAKFNAELEKMPDEEK